MRAPARALLELARAHGVQAGYVDTTGRRRMADVEALLAVLAALGEPLEHPEAAAGALERRRAARDDRPVEPVLVAWDGRLRPVPIRLGARPGARIRAHLRFESGQERAWAVATDDLRGSDGVARLRVDGALPIGRHELSVEIGRRSGTAAVLSAPRRVRAADGPREWGVFLPVHALVTERDWGIGDFTGLEELADLVRGLGGGMVATLPLLAGFAGEASPYRPVSRLFWNEVYLDVDRVPGIERAAPRRVLRSASFGRELESLRSSELVDHARALALKRRVLEPVASSFDAEPDKAFRRYRREHPELEDYARFRAAGERLGLEWRGWPSRLRGGSIGPGDVDPAAVAYHRFAQWAAEEQIAGLGQRWGERAGLYLDVPVGVHLDGFDVWRRPGAFSSGVSVGAPPDDFFPGGQDWGVAPLHPGRVREDGYAYPIACLRHVFRHAGVARLDHAIGLHRQYWVPSGMPADRGVFVRFPAEEWYAAISLEAHRTGTIVVGEDLGTVPLEIRATMDRHRLLRCYVLELETLPERTPAVPEPSPSSLATLNTHDLPTFAAFWRGDDIRDRLADGFLDPGAVAAEERRRVRMRQDLVRLLVGAGALDPAEAEDERAVLSATLAWLAASESRLVVVNLEDLWGELRQQNVPGTVDRPNFRRRAARSLEDLRTSRDVLEILRRVDAARRRSLMEGDAA